MASIIFFYPLDFTFVCPTEIIAFSEAVDQFKQINTEIVAASVDSVYSHLAWINTPRADGGLGKVNFPLISDITQALSRRFGVYSKEEGVSLRGLFIINGDGVLRSNVTNDLAVGRSVEEIIRLVKAFQYTDTHGEVCPANWQPGQLTMIADPIKSKNYFNELEKQVEKTIEKVLIPEPKTEEVVKAEPKVEQIVIPEPKKEEVVKAEPKAEVVRIEPKVEEVVKSEPKVEQIVIPEPKTEVVVKAEPKVEQIVIPEPKKEEVVKAEPKKRTSC